MSVNGSPEVLDLLVEHPDDLWVRRMLPDAQPALYKAIVAARFRYAGEDPAGYALVFNQKAETQDIGPQPMIDFLRFIDLSTDAEFEAHLDEHLDTQEFARYLAFQNLITDPDSLAGTGNNYYLLYDPTTRRMSFAPWDQNLAFGRLGIGGGATYRPYYEDGATVQIGNLPGLEELVPGEGNGEPNRLVTRFLASPKYRQTYERAYREMFDAALTSGRADSLIDRLGDVIRTANGKRHFVDPVKLESDIARDKQFIADRIAFLQTVAPIAG